MLLSALDPALFVFVPDDWASRTPHCFVRCSALLMHRAMTREYGQRMATSEQLVSLAFQLWPWTPRANQIPELRDIRRFILEDLQKAKWVRPQMGGELSIEPINVGCEHIGDSPEVARAWRELLQGCLADHITARFDLQIATWKSPGLRGIPSAIRIVIRASTKMAEDGGHRIPLVWDEDTWYSQLATQDWWPDLERCTRICFLTTPSMQRHPSAASPPMPLQCTERFWQSLQRPCRDRTLRRALVKALTKRRYGILDASLGDEAIGSLRRFRVTKYWRVHYEIDIDHERLVLQQFGGHDMRGVA